MFQITTLDNGLRIVTSSMPHTRSVTISFFVGAGSRYEQPEKAGISHFVEHLCFKGTSRRRSAKEISEAIEGVGGMLNGGTDRELTIYWCKVPRPHFALALDVLVDMLRNSTFDADEVEKERKVIIEELNMVMDSPQQLVDVLIDGVIWPDQALGRDVAGSKETVNGLDQAALVEYLNRQYTPDNTVLSVAGNVEHEEVVEAIRQAMSDWAPGSPSSWIPAENGQSAPRLRVQPRKTEQAHVCVAVQGLSSQHPDRFNLDVLNIVLGEGMSSRLFLEVREKRGLAYDIHSYVSHFRDAGALTVYAGVDPSRAGAAIEAIVTELSRLKDGVPPAEVEKAKELTKGRLLLRMEDTRSVASWIGGQELLNGHIRTVDDVVDIVDAIKTEDLQRVAQELLITDKLNLAVVGPFRSEKRFTELLKI